jgi:hypothetical protein
MNDYRPRRPSNNDGGLTRIDWRGTLWGTLCLLLLSSVLLFVFPAMHGMLRVILVLALYFCGRYAYGKYVPKR